MNARDAAEVIERIRLVSILRAPDAQAGMDTASELVQSGVRALEFSFASPGAVESIRAAREEFNDTVLVGAGTVLTPEQATEAVDAGADFLVSPNVDPAVMQKAAALEVLHVPGALTPTEVARALGGSAILIKLFPAGVMGPGYVSDLLAPFPTARLVPTGGIGPDNLTDFLAAGAVAVAVGSALSAQPDSARRLVDLAATGGDPG